MRTSGRVAADRWGASGAPRSPLVVAVGTRLLVTFMWMHEEELDDGSVLHAYKHTHTRRYLYLSADGRAFEQAACGGFVPMQFVSRDCAGVVQLVDPRRLDVQYAVAVRDDVLRVCE